VEFGWWSEDSWEIKYPSFNKLFCKDAKMFSSLLSCQSHSAIPFILRKKSSPGIGQWMCRYVGSIGGSLSSDKSYWSSLCIRFWNMLVDISKLWWQCILRTCFQLNIYSITIVVIWIDIVGHIINLHRHKLKYTPPKDSSQ